MTYFMNALQIMAIVSAWSVHSLSDGKVTLKEAADLAEKIARVLGVNIELDVGSEGIH